jgi:putative flippase GtrA
MTTAGRVARFYAVGLLGVPVQLCALAALTRCIGMNYVPATAVAVEIAVIHNFLWHDRWTWPGGTSSGRVRRFWRFNVANGLVSVVSNVVVTKALVDAAGLPYLPANLIAILAASVANYIAADEMVFRPQGRG